MIALLLATGPSLAGNDRELEAGFRAEAQKKYDEAHQQHQKQPTNVIVLIEEARACFDLAEFAKNNAERTSLAEEGMGICCQIISCQPTLAEGHYLLGLNIGQLARVKLYKGLKLVRDMEENFTLASKIDGKLDYGGADRCLGLLYRDAPGWPISVGNRGKARQHLLKALQLAPNYPENHLNLLESYLGWSEWTLAAKQLILLTNAMAMARTNLTGKAWEPSWYDWNSRCEAAKAKLSKHK